MHRQTLAESPKNVRMRKSYAYALLKRDLFEEMADEYRQILAITPYDAESRIGLGKALVDQGRLVEGMQEYEKVRVPGQYAQVLKDNIYATALLIIDRYRLDVQKDPYNATLYYSLGVMHTKIDDIKASIAYFEKALALDPQHQNAAINLGSSYRALSNWPKARSYFQHYFTLRNRDRSHDPFVHEQMQDICRHMDCNSNN